MCPGFRVIYRKTVDMTPIKQNGMYALPLDMWDDGWWEYVTERNDICKVCRAEMKRTKTIADQAFWEDLPKVFKLGNWAIVERG